MNIFSFKSFGLLVCLFCVVENCSAQLVMHPSLVQDNAESSNELDLNTPFFYSKNPLVIKARNMGLDDNIADVDTVGAETFYVGKDSLMMYCKKNPAKNNRRYCWFKDAPEALQKPVKVVACSEDCPITEESWDRDQKIKERKKDKRDPHEKDMDRERRTAFRVMLKAAPFMAAGALCHLDASCSE